MNIERLIGNDAMLRAVTSLNLKDTICGRGTGLGHDAARQHHQPGENRT
jgi:hypothetical protein